MWQSSPAENTQYSFGGGLYHWGYCCFIGGIFWNTSLDACGIFGTQALVLNCSMMNTVAFEYFAETIEWTNSHGKDCNSTATGSRPNWTVYIVEYLSNHQSDVSRWPPMEDDLKQIKVEFLSNQYYLAVVNYFNFRMRIFTFTKVSNAFKSGKIGYSSYSFN